MNAILQVISDIFGLEMWFGSKMTSVDLVFQTKIVPWGLGLNFCSVGVKSKPLKGLCSEPPTQTSDVYLNEVIGELERAYS